MQIGTLHAPGMRRVKLVSLSRKQMPRNWRVLNPKPGRRRRVRGHHNVVDLQRQAQASGGRFSLATLMYGALALITGR